MTVTDRLLDYVKFDTQSDELTNMTPSTPGQMIFARHLRDILTQMGLSEITLDENGYLMATLEANNGNATTPTVGFIAHLDTSPDMSGRHVNPRIVKNYDGNDITLNSDEGIVLSPTEFPELMNYVGQDLIVTDGTTLLGADDKAGIAEIVTAVAYLQAHPEINFIGCEVFAAGVGALSKRLHDIDLKNVRIFRHDAVEVVRDMLEDESLDGVHIFFPDPWRKARHHKRRLINESFLKLLLPKMKKGAYFHSATDWENYAEQMAEVLSAEPTLKNLHEGAAPQPENPLVKRPTTKFNERGNRLGHGCWDFVYTKI